jgi:NAD(P)-dependent dehydrogenase (short-subunit alcohol dehydrogenase family)
MTSPLRVFITGGTRGIGRAIALRFAREGAKVCVAARTSPDLDRVVGEIDAAGGQGEACQANMRDHGSVEAAVFRAVDFCDGALDIVVNNAGTFDYGAFEATDMASWAVPAVGAVGRPIRPWVAAPQGRTCPILSWS